MCQFTSLLTEHFDFNTELGGKVLQNAVQQATQIYQGHHNL